MTAERRGQAIRVATDLVNRRRDEPIGHDRGAAALKGWHEPCELRGSRTVL